MELIALLFITVIICSTSTVGWWLSGGAVNPDWLQFLGISWGVVIPLACILAYTIYKDK